MPCLLQEYTICFCLRSVIRPFTLSVATLKQHDIKRIYENNLHMITFYTQHFSPLFALALPFWDVPKNPSPPVPSCGDDDECPLLEAAIEMVELPDELPSSCVSHFSTHGLVCSAPSSISWGGATLPDAFRWLWTLVVAVSSEVVMSSSEVVVSRYRLCQLHSNKAVPVFPRCYGSHHSVS